MTSGETSVDSTVATMEFGLDTGGETSFLELYVASFVSIPEKVRTFEKLEMSAVYCPRVLEHWS
jgi:hypothetical protein